MSDNIHFLGDNAISRPEQDLFNFKFYAEKVQRLIQHNSSNTEPITIGIYGKWGEGKTSFLNLIENKIDHFEKNQGDKEYLKFHFNPWRYSSEDEMLFDFFDSLSKKFYVKENTNLQEVGKWISKYSKYLKAIKISTTVGIPKIFNSKVTFDSSEIFKALGENFEGEKLTLEGLKDKVNEAIKKVNFKVVVFIDDLDRLDKEEIYTILKLIKLNANFSNFVFIVNLDSEQVAKAIKHRYGDEVLDGKFFLEKIINIPIHLPRIEEEDLKEFFKNQLFQVKNNLGLTNSEKLEEFNQINMDFSGKYYSSPREIIRVLNSFFIGAFAIAEEVNLRDLFWIEYVKIKNESCYNLIKNYSNKSSFSSFQNIIDFNDDFESDAVLNGTRKQIMEVFNDGSDVINSLFPINHKTNNFFNKKLDADLLEKELRINSAEHFEKYFSYHSLRKISSFKINQIEELIRNNDSEKLVLLLRELFLEESQHYKIVYRIEKIVKGLNEGNGRSFFYEFIFKNFELIPDSKQDVYGLDYKIRLIELIASVLNSDYGSENEGLSLKLAEMLDINHLCYFTRKFKQDKTYKNKLEKIIALKAHNLSVDTPFYKEPFNHPNKMIMYYWKQGNELEYQDYIKQTIISEENIKLLIRNFPPFWNNSFFGPLEKDQFDYMSTLIDVDFIYKKLKEFNLKLVENIDVDSFEFPNIDECTVEQNLEQFIYWCKKNENRRKLLLL
jgi:hypothetical protein